MVVQAMSRCFWGWANVIRRTFYIGILLWILITFIDYASTLSFWGYIIMLGGLDFGVNLRVK